MIGILAQQLDEIRQESQQIYEALQIEAARRYEIMLQENARRHEQLLKLISIQAKPSSPQSPGILASSQAPLVIRERKQPTQNHTRGNTSQTQREEKGKRLLPNPYRPQERVEDHQRRFNQHVPYTKLEFPTFHKEEPREWSSRCEQYFRIYQVLELQWVEIATMHFTRKAHRWTEGYLFDKPEINWEELVEAMCKRFDRSDMGRMIREFNKLVQTSTVERF